jgi:hypothetical protein
MRRKQSDNSPKSGSFVAAAFRDAHELQLNGVDGYQSQNDFTHTRRSHEFYHGAFPLSRSVKVAFPRALSA